MPHNKLVGSGRQVVYPLAWLLLVSLWLWAAGLFLDRQEAEADMLEVVRMVPREPLSYSPFTSCNILPGTVVVDPKLRTVIPEEYCRPESRVPSSVSCLQLKMQRNYNFTAAPPDQRPEVASFKFTATALGEPATGLHFQLVLVGPALLPVAIVEVGRGEYKASFAAVDIGHFAVQGNIVWESAEDAFGPYRNEGDQSSGVQQKAPLLRQLMYNHGSHLSLVLAVMHIRPDSDGGPQRNSASRPCSLSDLSSLNGTGGRWTGRSRHAAGHGPAAAWNWREWRPWNCRLTQMEPQAVTKCFTEKSVRLLMMGDLHMQALHDAIAQQTRIPRTSLKFIQSASPTKENSTHTKGGMDRRTLALSYSASIISNTRLWTQMDDSGNTATHIVWGRSQSDLWDVTVDVFVEDSMRLVRLIFKYLQDLNWQGLFIWRTQPSFSFKASNLHPHDFPSNEKIALSRERILPQIQGLVAEGGWSFRVGVMDSFSVTMPRSAESVHEHLYLSPTGSLQASPASQDHALRWPGHGNDIGVADLHLLLNAICNPLGDSEL